MENKLLTKLIMLFVVVAAIAFAGCASKLPPAAQTSQVQTTSEQSGGSAIVVDAKQVNGIQEASLSWGKLNYNPEVIKVKKGLPVRIIADTARLQGCFRSFRIADLEITKSFTETDNTVEFTPQKSGTFAFGCSMGMGAGRLVVE
ncbi:cupredoxin domain-containing protein [Candidatus Woesearchaeota archaeon]|nr:cupredoxin domain-containing protein [Candidatus Woesearchaeota archaeon]